MVKIYFCLIFLSTIRFIATAPLQKQDFDLNEKNLVEVEKILRTIQHRLHEASPGHIHEDGQGVSHQDTALSTGEEPEKSKLVFMLFVSTPDDAICDNEQINLNYTIEGYNHDLKCKCRFCIRNMIDKKYEERCFPDPCAVESVGDVSGDGENEEDSLMDALNVIKEQLSPDEENKTDYKNPMLCETKPCDRPDMDEINKLRCKGNECHFRYI